jgi:hypothetical protein
MIAKINPNHVEADILVKIAPERARIKIINPR